MAFEELRTRLADVVAIPVTPFDNHGSVDDAGYARILLRMSEIGINVVTPNGNTSEYYSLTEDEAKHAAELTVATVGARCTVLVGVGHAVPDAIRAAEHARGVGADAIMVHQPVHPYLSKEGWVEYHRQIAAAVPEIGVVLYVKNPRIDGATIAHLADASPNLVAVKYSVPDPVTFATAVKDCNREHLVWIAGLAELSAPGYWATGATGFTSGLANITPRLSLDILNSLRNDKFDQAMEAWALIEPFEKLRALNGSENNVSVVKEALAQVGLCRRHVRPPITTLSQAGRSLVRKMVQTWRQVGELEESLS